MLSHRLNPSTNFVVEEHSKPGVEFEQLEQFKNKVVDNVTKGTKFIGAQFTSLYNRVKTEINNASQNNLPSSSTTATSNKNNTSSSSSTATAVSSQQQKKATGATSPTASPEILQLANESDLLALDDEPLEYNKKPQIE